MDVFATLCIRLYQIHLFKVVDSNLQISTDYLNINNDFLISSARNGVSVLLVCGQRVRNDASCCQFKLGKLGLSMQN